jgi:hypothetical protein
MFYLELFRALDQEKVRYLLVGGMAVNLHGAERMTMDIDLMVDLDPENLPRFLAAARALSLKPANLPVRIEQLCDPDTVRIWVEERHMLAMQLRGPALEAPSVDILLRTAVAFEDAYLRRHAMTVEGVPVSVIAVRDLIALKEAAGRKVDRSDIQALHRVEMLKSRRRED